MSQHLRYRPDVDGLRAVAVLSVVFHHAKLGAPGGYVGVDVFFVISGYLIAGLIRKDLAAGTFSLADFWARRVRRILPALAVVVAATLAAGWRLLLPQHFASLGNAVLALFALGANIHYWKGVGYFEAEAESKPLLHTWSLAVEEQFYVIMPFLLLHLHRRYRPRTAVATLAVAFAVTFGLSAWWTWRGDVAAFYVLQSRAWELLTGTLLAYTPAAGAWGRDWRGQAAALVGMAGIVAPVFLYTKTTLFPGLAAAPPVFGTALVIWAGGRPGRLPLVNWLLALRPVVFVGLISYSLYLWHWPLIVFANYYSLDPLSTADRWLVVAAGFGAGVLSWRFVETPFRTKWLLPTRPRLFIGAGVAVAGLALTAFGIRWADGVPGRLPPLAREYAAAGVLDQTYAPSFNAADVPGKLARFGGDGPARLFVWGDSYAMAVLPAIESLGYKHGLPAVVATRAGSAPIAAYTPRGRPPRPQQTRDYNDAVLAHVLAAKYDVVLFAGYWSIHLNDDTAPGELLKTMDAVAASGARVYFMREPYLYPYDVAATLAKYTLQGRETAAISLPASARAPLDGLYADILPRVQAHGVTVLDPTPYFRDQTDPARHIPFDGGGSFYRDRGHLSTYGALKLEPMFEPMYEEIRTRRPASPSK